MLSGAQGVQHVIRNILYAQHGPIIQCAEYAGHAVAAQVRIPSCHHFVRVSICMAGFFKVHAQ